ncbi:hypothetical protein [Hymenobacter psoromatis]|uniref:hypothetical protein n=1 Tax=Hymenobacter psoromatis TaxID=1484116 RepID=UPI001CBE404E|nr:hypothetical protein [Hymenobacter psoromatis]
MTHRYALLLPPLLALAGGALAQTAPTITAADMPVAGDSLRLSQAAVVLPASAPALTMSGPSQTWDYSGLMPASQRVQRYNAFAASATGLQLLFFTGANKASISTPQLLPTGAGAALPITDTKEFFNLANNLFYSVGFGATVSGTALPVLYAQNNDVIYSLPVTYSSNSTTDFFLSNSLITASLPGTGYLSRQRQRINRADAWGTVTTPYGTFQALRVVTSLADHDSVVVGAGPGQGLDLPLVREYKWLATGQHVPVLTITTATVAGREVITGVEYRDSYRHLVPLATRGAAGPAGLSAYPNPSAVGTALRLAAPAGGGPLRVVGTDLLGRRLFAVVLPAPAGEVTLGADLFGAFRGVALLTVQSAQGVATQRVVRE